MLAPTYLELKPTRRLPSVSSFTTDSVCLDDPPGAPDMPTEELLALERESFLQWRRSLAELEANNRLKTHSIREEYRCLAPVVACARAVRARLSDCRRTRSSALSLR
jgi:hypothetical protein